MEGAMRPPSGATASRRHGHNGNDPTNATMRAQPGVTASQGMVRLTRASGTPETPEADRRRKLPTAPGQHDVLTS